MFKPYTSYIRYKLNSAFFNTNEVTIYGNIPSSAAGIVDIGAIDATWNATRFFNGILHILLRIMTDNRILAGIPEIKMQRNTRSTYLRDRVPAGTTESLVLAAEYNNVEWMREYIAMILSETQSEYWYGVESGGSDSVTRATLYKRYGVDVDQYFAAIVNNNLRHLLQASVTRERIESLLYASSFSGTRIFVPEQISLSPYSCFDLPTCSRVVIMSAFVLENFCDLALEENRKYFDSINLFTYEPNFTLCNLQTDNNPTLRGVYDFLDERRNASDFSDIDRMLALEISPAFRVFTMVRIPSPVKIDQAIVVLLELYLFQLFFPNNFDRIKGQAQTVLLDCFRIINQSEVTSLLGTYGYKYTIDEQTGERHYHSGSGIPFSNSQDYLSNTYPILFGDMAHMNVPTIQSTMALFIPIGELVRDDGAINAGYTRLSENHSHYIPMRYSEDGDSMRFSDNVGSFLSKLSTLIDVYRSTSGSARSSPAIVAATEFLTSIRTHFRELDSSMCTLYPLYMRVAANGMFNIGDSFNGDYTTFKRQDYGLFDNGVLKYTLYRRTDGISNNVYQISTSVIFHQVGQSSTVIMRNAGKVGNKVAFSSVNETVPIPNEGLILQSGLRTYMYLEQALIPITLVSILFSNNVMPDITDKIQIRLKLKLTNVAPSLLTKMADALAESMNVSLGEYGVVYRTQCGYARKTPVCVDPTVQRINSVTQTPIDYDITVDNRYLGGIIVPISPVMRDRLLIGMRFLVRGPLFQVKKGLRLMKYSLTGRDPGYTPEIPANAIVMDYVDTMFISSSTSGVTMMFLSLEGQQYARVSDWPVIHLKIHDLSTVHARHVGLITQGINGFRLIVDVLNQEFIPKIVPQYISTSQYVETILLKGFDAILEIPFCDTSGNLNIAEMLATGLETYDQYVFPLCSVTDDYVIGGLIDPTSRVPPSGTILPSNRNIDTGDVDVNFSPIYSDGDLKILSRQSYF